MMRIGAIDVCFTEPLHTLPFLMTVEEEGYIEVNDQLLYLHFNIQHGLLVLVEREEFDEDMVLMRIVYQRPRYSNIGLFYRVTPRYYKVQWVGRSETPALPLNILDSRSAANLQQSKSFHSKEKLPTVPECPKAEIAKVEVLSLSSDSNSHCEDGSDSDYLPSGVTTMAFTSTNCDREDLSDDDCLSLVNESFLNVDVKAIHIEEPRKYGGTNRARDSRSRFVAKLKGNDSGSLAFGGSPSVGDMSKNLSPKILETPLKDLGSLSLSENTPQWKSLGLCSMQQSSDGPWEGISKASCNCCCK